MYFLHKTFCKIDAFLYADTFEATQGFRMFDDPYHPINLRKLRKDLKSKTRKSNILKKNGIMVVKLDDYSDTLNNLSLHYIHNPEKSKNIISILEIERTQINNDHIIIAFHGASVTNMYSAQYFIRANPKVSKVFCIEYTNVGFGKIKDNSLPSQDQIIVDCIEAIAYIVEKYKDKKIIIYGRSLGCSISGFSYNSFVEKYPMLMDKIIFLFMDSPVSSVYDVLRNRSKVKKKITLKISDFIKSLFVLKSKWNLTSIINMIAKSKKIYIVHHKNDSIVPYIGTQNLVQFINGKNKKNVIFKENKLTKNSRVNHMINDTDFNYYLQDAIEFTQTNS